MFPTPNLTLPGTGNPAPTFGGGSSLFGSTATPSATAPAPFSFGTNLGGQQQPQQTATSTPGMTNFGGGSSLFGGTGGTGGTTFGTGGSTTFGGTGATTFGTGGSTTFGSGSSTTNFGGGGTTNFGGSSLFGNPAVTTTPVASSTGTLSASAPFSFGTNLGSTPTPTLGLSSGTGSTPSFGLGGSSLFGAPVTSTPIATVAPSTATPFSFGTPTTQTTSTLPSTLPTSTPTPGTTLGGGSSLFGNAPFSFGTPTTQTTSTLPSTLPTSTPGTNFGGGSSLFGNASLGTTTSLPVASSTSTLTSTPFSFGTKLGAAPTTTTTTSTIPPLTFGGGSSLFGNPANPIVTSAAPTPSTGLGGIPKYASSGADTTFAFGGSTEGKTENRAINELPLPQEMLLLVDELKSQIKSNKLKFTELTRSSNENIICKVTEEIEEVRGSVTVISNLIHKQSSNCDAIRKLIQEGIVNAEMANITRETPISSQADHTTPIQYFFKLFDSFRERMNIYLREIEKAENSLSFVLSVQSAFTAKELFNALKGTRDSVIVLSAKVQILHEEVIREIEAHRNLQRYLLGETKEFRLPEKSKYTIPFSSGLLDKREANNYSKVGLLFPHKLVDPPKIQILNMSQNLNATVKTTTPPAKTSTPFFSRIPGSPHQMHPSNKSSDSLFYPSNSLFQTQQSTILSPSQSSSPVPGISLKRTKH